jgi:hypothetical protein
MEQPPAHATAATARAAHAIAVQRCSPCIKGAGRLASFKRIGYALQAHPKSVKTRAGQRSERGQNAQHEAENTPDMADAEGRPGGAAAAAPGYTLAIVKPDAVAAGKADEMLHLAELSGFTVIQQQRLQVGGRCAALCLLDARAGRRRDRGAAARAGARKRATVRPRAAPPTAPAGPRARAPARAADRGARRGVLRRAPRAPLLPRPGRVHGVWPRGGGGAGAAGRDRRVARAAGADQLARGARQGAKEASGGHSHNPRLARRRASHRAWSRIASHDCCRAVPAPRSVDHCRPTTHPRPGPQKRRPPSPACAPCTAPTAPATPRTARTRPPRPRARPASSSRGCSSRRRRPARATARRWRPIWPRGCSRRWSRRWPRSPRPSRPPARWPAARPLARGFL